MTTETPPVVAPDAKDERPSRGADRTDERCRNCGARAPDRYCPNCGQETALALPTAGAFLREAAGRYVAFDGRMWRSLHALLFRPGFLTRQYLSGRRRRYVRPARLFVALSIVFFAVLRFASGGTTLDARTPDQAAASELLAAGAAPDARDGVGLRIEGDDKLHLDTGGSAWLAPLARRLEDYNRLPSAEKAEQVRAGMLRYAPYAAIGLLPLFALLLKLVYAASARRHSSRPQRYAAHLVFGAHTHAFAFLAATLYTVIGVGALRAGLVFWMIVYGLVSMKTVYGGGWLGVVPRAAAIAFVYLIFFSVAVAAVVVAAVLLR